jgi:hypothetical protein
MEIIDRALSEAFISAVKHIKTSTNCVCHTGMESLQITDFIFLCQYLTFSLPGNTSNVKENSSFIKRIIYHLNMNNKMITISKTA